MIGQLTGKVTHLDDDHLILDVNGVGYLVYLSSSTLSDCQVGGNLSLFIEMIVKEDQLTLYGFSDIEDKRCFKLLQIVQGVGAKMAIAILSALSASQIANAILAEDIAAFKNVSGVGPKIAARIVNELKTKKIPVAIGSASSKDKPVASHLTDALSALSNLGFNRTEAFKVLQELQANDDKISLEELIRQSLAKLS